MSDESKPSGNSDTLLGVDTFQGVGALVVLALLIAAVIAMRMLRPWSLILGILLFFIALLAYHRLRARSRAFKPIATSRATVSYVSADTARVHYVRLHVADTRGVELAIALGSVVLTVGLLLFIAGMLPSWRSYGADSDTVGLVVTIALFALAFDFYGMRLVMRLFNPRPSVVISSDVVVPGQNVKLTWLIEGRIEKLQRLRIDVIGAETVFIGLGRNRQKIVNEFACVPVADQRAPVNVNGAAHATIPDPTKVTVPGGESAYRVEWAVRIREEIANWPDSDVRFPFTVAASAQ